MAIAYHIKHISMYLTRSSPDKKKKTVMKKYYTKITICAFCVKNVGDCKCKRRSISSYAVRTTTGHWKKIKKEYRWKIHGTKKLSCYLQRVCENEIKE